MTDNRKRAADRADGARLSGAKIFADGKLQEEDEEEAWAMPSNETVVSVEPMLHFVFDGPPGPEAGRFVECETPDGRSVNAGEWHERADGLWELRVPVSRPSQPPEHLSPFCDTTVEQPPVMDVERDALRWFSDQHRLALEHYSPIYGDDADESVEWRVTEQRGSINDREYVTVGRGETAEQAIIAAMQSGEG